MGPSVHVANSFALIPTTSYEIIQLAKSSKYTRSEGADGIDPLVGRQTIELTAEIISEIINLSFETGQIPVEMKKAKITPIFKQGDRANLTNYRPISILPYFSKLMEKAVSNRLTDYIEKISILYPMQYGFRQNHSVDMALVNIQDLITEAIDANKYSIGVFLDLAKAFDTVDHSILLKKMSIYGIRGIPLDWFSNYLSERCQQVQCNGVLSMFKSIKYGVPQGSNLGPLLFLLYINDLPNATKVLKYILFADDTNAFCSNDSLSELIHIINEELKMLLDWFRANRLSINTKKSCFIIFRVPNKKANDSNNTLLIDGNNIEQVTYTKFLGLYIDEHLTWNTHIKITTSKLAKNIGIIRKISYLLPTKVLTNLYYTLVYPYLLYGNLVWASNYETRLRPMTILQKRIIRIMAGDSYYAHTRHRFKQLKLLKFEQINRYLIGLFMYKALNKLLPPMFQHYFTKRHDVHDYYTRASGSLSVQYARTDYRRFSLSCKGPIIWNKIPSHISNVSTFALFKKVFKNFLISQDEIG